MKVFRTVPGSVAAGRLAALREAARHTKQTAEPAGASSWRDDYPTIAPSFNTLLNVLKVVRNVVFNYDELVFIRIEPLEKEAETCSQSEKPTFITS